MPPARFGAAAAGNAPDHRSREVEVAGVTSLSRQFNDVWELKLDSLCWQQLNPTGTPPSVRESHGVFLDGNRLIVFGGEGYDGFFDDVHYIRIADLAVNEWQPVEPNPQSPSLSVPALSGRPVNISYVVSKPAATALRVIDLSGRVVRTLLSGAAAPRGSVAWDGRDDSGNPVPSGSYFCYLQTGQDGLSRKFILTE